MKVVLYWLAPASQAFREHIGEDGNYLFEKENSNRKEKKLKVLAMAVVETQSGGAGHNVEAPTRAPLRVPFVRRRLGQAPPDLRPVAADAPAVLGVVFLKKKIKQKSDSFPSRQETETTV